LSSSWPAPGQSHSLKFFGAFRNNVWLSFGQTTPHLSRKDRDMIGLGANTGGCDRQAVIDCSRKPSIASVQPLDYHTEGNRISRRTSPVFGGDRDTARMWSDSVNIRNIKYKDKESHA
jgi:hypothetical protein